MNADIHRAPRTEVAGIGISSPCWKMDAASGTRNMWTLIGSTPP
ncbi:hypothetical protein [Pseudomonas sp. BN414]|nr:hypothetical protein [Pseudomonas sp. BN414]